jgi:hypothetical protein
MNGQWRTFQVRHWKAASYGGGNILFPGAIEHSMTKARLDGREQGASQSVEGLYNAIPAFRRQTRM